MLFAMMMVFYGVVAAHFRFTTIWAQAYLLVANSLLFVT